MIRDRFPIDGRGETSDRRRLLRARLPEEMRAEKVIFVITTDGQECASHEYSAKMLKKLNYRATGEILSCMRCDSYSDEEMDLKMPQFFQAVNTHLRKGG